MKKGWKRDCNITAALLKPLLVFASLKVKHLWARFISRISFTSFYPNSQNMLFFYCGSGKWHEDESKVCGTDFLTWHMGWDCGPLENQQRTSSFVFKSSPKGLNLASHLTAVAVPGMGIVSIKFRFDNIWLCQWNIYLVMRLFHQSWLPAWVCLSAS